MPRTGPPHAEAFMQQAVELHMAGRTPAELSHESAWAHRVSARGRLVRQPTPAALRMARTRRAAPEAS